MLTNQIKNLDELQTEIKRLLSQIKNENKFKISLRDIVQFKKSCYIYL
jgi:hypothetical protein